MYVYKSTRLDAININEALGFIRTKRSDMNKVVAALSSCATTLLIKAIYLCTKQNYHEYWCLVDVNGSYTGSYTPGVDHWGECPLSCLDTSYKDNPPILNDTFSAGLFNNLEVGTEFDPTVSLKGDITDFYVWDFPLSQKSVEKYLSCQQDASHEKSIVSWKNFRKVWTLSLDGTSLVEKYNPPKEFCLREDEIVYIGFSEQMTFEPAMRHCLSFGGFVPLPNG